MRLEGKTAFVTGANSGIGKASAITFAREGADVAIHYRSDRSEIEQTADAIRSYGRKVAIFQRDFLDPANAEGLIEEVETAIGPLDILVNNAGGGAPGERGSTETFVGTMNINLVVPYILARDAAKLMIPRGQGSIINITSVHQDIPSIGGSGYCGAKAGLGMVTRCLSLEYAQSNIRVNNVGPGMIDTPMNANVIENPKLLSEQMARVPMRRPGEAQEIANTVLFLASDEASYVTGSSFYVDGALRQRAGLVPDWPST